ncbi:hypothetical protein QN361_24830 [Pseudomonas sp. 5C2]|nr:hypothetical protein [Pseudomonas sp. 5C2]
MKALLIYFFVTTLLSAAIHLVYTNNPSAAKPQSANSHFVSVLIKAGYAVWIGIYLFSGNY